MKKKFLYNALIILALTACTEQDIIEQPSTPNGGTEVRLPADVNSGELLIKFKPEMTDILDRTMTRATGSGGAMTRSGIPSTDEVLEILGGYHFERIFPIDSKNEERTRIAGLHLWYQVKFDEDTDLQEAAKRLSALGEISKVQGNQRIKRAYDVKNRRSYISQSALQQRAATRSGVPAGRFSDPGLPYQWHYINSGQNDFDKQNNAGEIIAGSSAGCDTGCYEAWQKCTGDPSVIVAVLDDGVMYTHPDLADNIWVNEGEELRAGTDADGNGYKDDKYGYNFVTNTANISWTDVEDIGHGTHVSGTIAAMNNGEGVCGIAGGDGTKNSGVKIMICQVFSGNNSVSLNGEAKAIKYAADNGASILQCSWGEPNEKVTTEEEYLKKFGVQADAINYFISKPRPGSPLNGGIAIVSAGNDSYGRCRFPGGYSKVVCVTSMGTDFTPSVFTNFGDAADITAPGGDSYYHNNDAGGVLSTVQIGKHFDGYAYMSGTSMSTPHVSGVAALALSYAKQLGKMFEPDEFRDMLLSAVNDIDSYLHGIKTYEPQGMVYNGKLDMDERRGKMGTGMIDAYKMLMAVRGTPAVTVEQKKATKISLGKYYGDVARLTYKLRVSDDVAGKLGLTCTTGEDGTVEIICTKQGAGLVYVETSNGGIDMSRELAIVCRAKAASNGGWL